jgi:catechol 2,3-dioxygenase-like lactoylglutathione lyase family enzyme
MTYKLTALTPMLETPDIETTIDFYTRVLGFVVENYVPGMGWASLKFGDINIMFALPNEHRNIPKPIMSGSLYFATENVDEVWAGVKEQCSICYPVEDFDYGMREFGIYDNNGYLLQFGQEVE